MSVHKSTGSVDAELQKSIEELLKSLPQTNYPVTTSFSRDIMLKLLRFSKDSGYAKVQDGIRTLIAAALKKSGY